MSGAAQINNGENIVMYGKCFRHSAIFDGLAPWMTFHMATVCRQIQMMEKSMQ